MCNKKKTLIPKSSVVVDVTTVSIAVISRLMFSYAKYVHVHEGKLELITWTGEREGYTLDLGASFEEESQGLQNVFEERFRGDVQRFYAYRPQAFRWTCCGTSASMDYGCGHHGVGSQPCTCNFCRHVNSNQSVCTAVPLTHSLFRYQDGKTNSR